MRVKSITKSRFRAGAAALGLAVGLAIAAPAFAEAPASSNGTAVAIMQASAALQSGDCAGAMGPLNQLWHDPYLEQNDPALASQFRFQLIACTAQTQGLPAALALSGENVSRAYDIGAYDLHVFLQLMNQQPEAAAITLDAALARFPEQGPNLTDMSVVGVLALNHDAHPETAQALLNRLEEVRWQIHNVSGRPLMGMLRLEGLRKAVKAGDQRHADLYRADLKTDSVFYILSQGDGTISDAGVPAEPIGPVINREIEDVRAVITANPADLMALSYLMGLEGLNDQNSLALTQLNGILDLVDKYGLENFGSQETYPGLLTTRAELYANVGRYIDAGNAYETGAAKLGGKAGGLLVSYMNFLIDRGQEKAGLALESRISQVALEDNQRFNLVINEACAAAYSGDTAGYTRAMALLSGNPLGQIKPYLCAGNPDAAAAALISAMGNPATRDATIGFMQEGLSPLSVSDRNEALVNALQALKTRPDVVAAAQANQIIIRKWTLRLN